MLVKFDRNIFLSPEVYNLTSDNDGAKYFKLTLIVNHANLAEFAPDAIGSSSLSDPVSIQGRQLAQTS